MKTEICKKHKIDYTGSSCGPCDLLNKKHSNKLNRIRAAIKNYEMSEAEWPEDDHYNLSSLLQDIRSILRSRK